MPSRREGPRLQAVRRAVLFAAAITAGCAATPTRTACVARADVSPSEADAHYATMALVSDGAPCVLTVAGFGPAPSVLFAPSHGKATAAAAPDGWRITYARESPAADATQPAVTAPRYSGGDWFTVADAAGRRRVVVDVSVLTDSGP